MNILGIIVEYNPFHNGHLYHIKKSKKITNSTKCIAVMSGNFVQRGTPALIDKYLRTKMALENGVDLIIELPINYATSSAEFFATGAIKTLDSTKIVNNFCFGSECGSLEKFYKYAKILNSEPKEFKINLKKYLAKGMSYPLARYNALKNITNEDISFLSSPNNILGLEYIKCLDNINSNIKPYTIKRHVVNHHSTDIINNFASASGIRKAIKDKNFEYILNSTPENVYKLLLHLDEEKKISNSLNNFSHVFHYILKTSKPSYLKNILDVDEGLENRILKKSEEAFYISEIIELVKCKRYTITRLQRAFLHILLNITKDELNTLSKPPYIRVLGFRKDSSFLLKKLEENATLPIITNIKNANKVLNKKAFDILNKEIISTDIYYMGQENYFKNPSINNIEYKKPLVII